MIDDVVSQFFIGKHGQRGPLAVDDDLRGRSTVRLPSWLITDITMSIIICRRRILRCSSIFSCVDWAD